MNFFHIGNYLRLKNSLISLPGLMLGVLISPAQAALPGAVTLGLELGPGQNYLSQNAWNHEVQAATTAKGESNSVDGQSQSSLSIGGSIGYVLNQLSLPLVNINYGLEGGFRVLGGGTRSVTWASGDREQLKNSINYTRLNLNGEMPLGTSGIFILGKAGVALVADRAVFSSNVSRVSGFNQTQDAAKPYLAAGIGLGGETAQIQFLLEHIGLPSNSQLPLASGQPINGYANFNYYSVGFSVAF